MSQVFYGSFVVGKKCIEKRASSPPLFPLEGRESSDYNNGGIVLEMREINPYQILTLVGIRNFNNNQEAIESGLGEGAVYRNGDQLCIVHHGDERI